MGIFLDFVRLTTRTPHGAYVRRARRNRIDRHGGGIERPAPQAYARYQNTSTGYIHENFPLGGQTDLGRAMGDTSTAFILDVYQLKANGGAGKAWLTRMWPRVEAAARFQLDSAALHGLPAKLACTYDWFGLETHDAAAYNGFMHVAALKAAAALGALIGGADAFVAAARAGYARREPFNSTRWWPIRVRPLICTYDAPSMGRACMHR